MKILIAVIFFILFLNGEIGFAQISAGVNPKDSVRSKILDSVIVNAWIKASDASYIPDVEGTKIFAGKKTIRQFLRKRKSFCNKYVIFSVNCIMPIGATEYLIQY